jgi:hypothetical protein
MRKRERIDVENCWAEEVLSDFVIEALRLPYRKCRKGAEISKISPIFHVKVQLIPRSLKLKLSNYWSL